MAKAPHSMSSPHALLAVEEEEKWAPSLPPVELDDDEEEEADEPVWALPVEPEPVELLPAEGLPVESLPVESEPVGSLPVEEGSAGSLPAVELEDGAAGAAVTVKAVEAVDSSARRPGPAGVSVHEAAPSGASAATVTVKVWLPVTFRASTKVESVAVTPLEQATLRATSTARTADGWTASATAVPCATLAGSAPAASAAVKVAGVPSTKREYGCMAKCAAESLPMYHMQPSNCSLSPPEPESEPDEGSESS